eukprot:986106-Prorocentrum_minimum.AAC.4
MDSPPLPEVPPGEAVRGVRPAGLPMLRNPARGACGVLVGEGEGERRDWKLALGNRCLSIGDEARELDLSIGEEAREVDSRGGPWGRVRTWWPS